MPTQGYVVNWTSILKVNVTQVKMRKASLPEILKSCFLMQDNQPPSQKQPLQQNKPPILLENFIIPFWGEGEWGGGNCASHHRYSPFNKDLVKFYFNSFSVNVSTFIPPENVVIFSLYFWIASCLSNCHDQL